MVIVIRVVENNWSYMQPNKINFVSEKMKNFKIAVVIPCYKCSDSILKVIEKIGSEINKIIVVDDCCPEGSGNYVKDNCKDPRVEVVFNKINLGVGGAMLHGYSRCLELSQDIIVKLDGDGQMDPSLIPRFISPIVRGKADYCKGNRFFFLEDLKDMPKIRLFGNSVLSFMNKLSSGYWNIFDPTNGYTAISSKALTLINFEKVSNRYFFESDLLFHLYLARAVVLDIPMKAIYGDERSNLKISKIISEFLFKHFVNFQKRIFFTYFLRNFSFGSIELVAGSILFIFGLIFGLFHWFQSSVQSLPATPGTVMLAALTFVLGIQFLVSFFHEDISLVPKTPLTSLLEE